MPSWRPRLSIRAALALAFGFSIAITAAALVLALESGRQNTIALVRDRSERIIDVIVQRIELHLRPPRDQSEFVASLVRKGDLDLTDELEIMRHLRTALAGTPQVGALAVIRTDLRQLRVERRGEDLITRSIDMRTVPGLDEAFEMAQAAGRPVWGEPLWSERLHQPMVNIRTPLWRGNSFLGILLTTVTVAELSQFLADFPAGSGVGAFIIYGRDHVLAHAALAKNPSLFKPDQPLPKIVEVGDPVLGSIWNADRNTDAAALAGTTNGHVVNAGGEAYVFMYREITGYSDQPWLVGRYLPLQELQSEVRRLEQAGWIGLAAVLFAVSGAWLLGYGIGKPIRQLAQSTAAIRTLDLTAARPLPGSRFRELDDAMRAYNALLASLHWFETYVPRQLVKRLMAQGERATALEERQVTVLFTDIADFTRLGERLTGPETAAFLNHHFGLLALCVEAENGTIDKFIGDSLMAFWGAPEAQPDQADRACRAARAIVATIIEDNRQRSGLGLPPIRVRVGIHTGLAMVGNIGAPGRINYTIVGDIVNTAQRLEQVAKSYMAEEEEALVVVSDVVIRSARDPGPAVLVSQQILRGRQAGTDVFKLA